MIKQTQTCCPQWLQEVLLYFWWMDRRRCSYPKGQIYHQDFISSQTHQKHKCCIIIFLINSPHQLCLQPFMGNIHSCTSRTHGTSVTDRLSPSFWTLTEDVSEITLSSFSKSLIEVTTILIWWTGQYSHLDTHGGQVRHDLIAVVGFLNTNISVAVNRHQHA